MSYVEKIISDIIQTTSDLFFRSLQARENQMLMKQIHKQVKLLETKEISQNPRFG